jgi:hypothetical protein
VKRDEHAVLLKRAEDAMPERLSSDVRHIGFWEGDDLGDDDQKMKRDEEAKSFPVFGVQHQGRDLHLAFVNPATNDTTIKIGSGPGPETEKNRHRLKKRDDPTPAWNRWYFDYGGLYAIIQADIDGAENAMQVDPNDALAHDSLVDDLACYFGKYDGHTSHPPTYDTNGLWFQIDDSLVDETLAAGVVAPFSQANPNSLISWMSAQGGLEVKDDCGNVDHDELKCSTTWRA